MPGPNASLSRGELTSRKIPKLPLGIIVRELSMTNPDCLTSEFSSVRESQWLTGPLCKVTPPTL